VSPQPKLTGGDKDVDIVVSLNLNPTYVDPHDTSHTTIDSLRQIPLAGLKMEQFS